MTSSYDGLSITLWRYKATVCSRVAGRHATARDAAHVQFEVLQSTVRLPLLRDQLGTDRRVVAFHRHEALSQRAQFPHEYVRRHVLYRQRAGTSSSVDSGGGDGRIAVSISTRRVSVLARRMSISVGGDVVAFVVRIRAEVLLVRVRNDAVDDVISPAAGGNDRRRV